MSGSTWTCLCGRKTRHQCSAPNLASIKATARREALGEAVDAIWLMRQNAATHDRTTKRAFRRAADRIRDLIGADDE